jgi:hypothetical protein
MSDTVDRHRIASRLRERIYLSVTALATVAAMLGSAPDPLDALRTLVVALAGTAAAMTVAESTAARIVEARALTGAEIRGLVADGAGALTVGVVPALLLAASAAGLLGVETALWSSAAALVAALVVASALALRRSGLPRRWAVLGMLGEAAIGAAVVLLRAAGH